MKKDFSTSIGEVTKSIHSESFMLPVASMIPFLPATKPSTKMINKMIT
jgi:hypothetical protein